MTTNALLRKHHDTLLEIEKDAAQTVQEAQDRLHERTAEHEAARQSLKGLKDTMDDNHRGFFGVARAILAMVHKRPSSPAEINDAILPILNYQSALAAVPAAEAACADAQKAEVEAEAEMSASTRIYASFKSLCNSADVAEK